MRVQLAEIGEVAGEAGAAVFINLVYRIQQFQSRLDIVDSDRGLDFICAATDIVGHGYLDRANIKRHGDGT